MALVPGSSLYLSLIDQAMPDALFVHDGEGRFVEVNQRACDTLGYTREELLTMCVTDVERDFDLPKARAVWQTIECGHTTLILGHQRRKDGSIFPVEVRFGLLEAAGERLYVGVVRDISERVKKEAELAAAHQKLVESERRERHLATRLFRTLRDTEHRANTILEVMSEGVVVHDRTGKVISANTAAQHITGLSLSELMAIGETTEAPWSILLEDGSPCSRENLPHPRTVRSGSFRNQIYGFQLPGGPLLWMSTSAYPVVLDNSTEPDFVVVVFSDVTERRTAEILQHTLEQDFMQLLESTSDFIYLKDRNGRIRFCSQALARISGQKSWRDMVGKNVFDLFPAAVASLYAADDETITATGIPLLDKIEPYTGEQGETLWASTSKWPIFGLDGKTVTGIFGISRDVSARKQMEEELRASATTDALTGLATRRAFLPQLEQEIARLGRKPKATSCLLLLDIDHFKPVNDAFGHGVGDDLLKSVADSLRAEVRNADSVARLGGDEFAILLAGTSLEGAKNLADRLRHKVASEPVFSHGLDHSGTLSIGITALAGSDSPQFALDRADRALYAAKNGGRNRVECA